MKDSKEKSAGFKKLFAKNSEIDKTYKPKKKHIVKNQHKSTKNKHTHKVPKKSVHKTPKPTESKNIQYSNIRTRLSTVDKIHGYQVACGFKSRDDLLSEMIKVCKPVLLNSSAKKKKYHKTIKLIHIARELKNNK